MRATSLPIVSPLLDAPPRRIALLTDFGRGPYVGQVCLRLAGLLPAAVPVIPLISDLAPWRPDLAAYLLPGLLADMPAGTLYLCVVDPGVGSDRGVLAMRRDADWLLAPDNGLLLPLLHRSPQALVYRVTWRPAQLSASFHGRDLFAPLAAHLVQGIWPEAAAVDRETLVGADWPAQQSVICYVDDYGNLMTGLDADDLGAERVLMAAGQRIARARTFSDVPAGQAFWYRNSLGLAEIAVNQGRAGDRLSLGAGAAVAIIEPPMLAR